MERFPATRARPGAVLMFAAAAVLAAAAAAVLVVRGERVLAGAGVAATGAALALADLLARGGAARARFAAAIVQRAVDGAVYGALAWALMPAAPRAGAAALAALSTSYVAGYLRAKATGLGFEVGGSLSAQPLQLAAVAVGLFAGGVEAGLWVAAAIGVAATAARIREVAVAEEAT